MTDLFANTAYQPIAAKMRPSSLDDFVGQQHLLAKNKPLYQQIMAGNLHSMILWGPPGCGKTTLANIMANNANARIEKISAVLAGVKDLRAVVERAKAELTYGKPTVLFVDEVHRFNKSQQDAFLPHVEEGTLILIGATTQNPSFELNNALLSRARVYKLLSLTENDILQLLSRAADKLSLNIEPDVLSGLAQYADGDARSALNQLEVLTAIAQTQDNQISYQDFLNTIKDQPRKFDNKGDLFYEQISALHKSVRGSNPDAALYWYCRMIDGGIDPLYIARRCVRMASEDIGNADPRALTLALNAWDVQERLGSPEGELAIAQAVIYLACAAKSNKVYLAYKSAMASVQSQSSFDVPIHLRNASSKLMRELDYGKEYQYAHDYPYAYVPNEQYFPDNMKSETYYEPVSWGLEAKIREKLDFLKELDDSENKDKP